MRALATAGLLAGLAACGSVPIGDTFLETPDGVRIHTPPGSCVSPATEELSNNVKYERLALVQDGRVRQNPRFLFNREPFSFNMAQLAQNAVASLQGRIMSACSEWVRAPADRKPAYWKQRDELLVELVHLATRIEAAKTPEEHKALLDEARLAANRRLEEDIRAGR